MRRLFLIHFLIISCGVYSATVNKTIYINAGQMTCFDGNQMFYNAFNESTVFNNQNTQLSIQVGDSLLLKIINNDSIIHGFDIKWTNGLNQIIPSGDSSEIIFSSQEVGAFIYFDPLNYPNNAYVGLSGIIAVGINTNSYFWNIKDHKLSWNDTIGNGNQVNWLSYYPDYFTINGKSNPNINLDTSARVVGNIGDTILIFMANTGQAEHSIHFHGYHCEIISSSFNANHVGRSKDTFPIKVMESYVLKLIPHQTGEYPVHDHNLLAITGGGLYPFGMFLTILIQ
ncbi:MAG: multicopper oxidase domain-containing protein [Crocinitomicaceae bacterium]|nr:multicopper oxidase domain-containing protein [Crocinitomicaceae bacterium]